MDDKELLAELEDKIERESKKNMEYEEKWGKVLDELYEGENPAERDISASSAVALYEPSNLVLATIGGAVDVAHSSLINILTQTYPLYLLKDYPEELATQALALEKDLNKWYLRMNSRLSLDPIVREFLLHGFAPVKLVRDFFSNVPYLELIPRKDIVMPETRWTPDVCNRVEFVGHRFYLTPWELEIRRDKYKNVDELLEKTKKTKADELIEFWEIYKYDDKMKDYVYTVSFEHNAIIKNEEFPYPRGFFIFPFQTKRHSLRGIGMGQQLKALQDERDSLHNLNINAIKIYINKLVGVLENTGIDLSDVRAGAKLYMQNLDSIKVFDLIKDLHPVQFTAEENSGRYAQARSLITDYRMGMEQKGVERSTARGVAMLLSESNKISNYVVDNIKDVMKEVGYTVLVWSYLDSIKPFFTKKEKLGQIKSIQSLKEILSIEIGINSAVLNKEVERNNALIITQVLTQYFERITPLLMAFIQAPPPLQEAISRTIKVADEMLEKVIRTFDVELTLPRFSEIIQQGGTNAGVTSNIGQALAEFHRSLMERNQGGQNMGGVPVPSGQT